MNRYIFKLKKSNGGFTMLPNKTILYKGLSLDGLGLITFAVSHPEIWKLRQNHILAHFSKSNRRFGRESLRKTWDNIESCGFCWREHGVRQKGGQLATETTIYAEHQPLLLEAYELKKQGKIKEANKIAAAVKKSSFTEDMATDGG